MKKGDQQTARAMNRRLILNILRKQGATSRAAIAAESGLSPAAVTFVISDLLEEGLVSEGETVKGAGGRRPIPVSLNYAARLTIGMKLTTRGIEAVLADLSTAAHRQVFCALPDTRPETVVAKAADIVSALLPDEAERRRRLVGIGVALPGSYDAERRVCSRLSRFGWHDVPIADLLAARTDVPVWVDNDVNAFALAQHLFGSGQSHRNILAFAVGAGVGAAFMTEGMLHRGAHGAAGEIGHLTASDDGPVCECGRRGCVQTYWSEQALVSRWSKMSDEDLADAIARNEPKAMDLLAEAVDGLGTLLSQLTQTLDPDVIIVGGEGVRFGEKFRAALEADVHAKAFLARPPVIFDWQDNSWSRGAAALVAQHFFDFEAEANG